MEITKIKRIGSTNRFHIYVDEKWFGIFLDETLARYGFKIGQMVDAVEFSRIKKEKFFSTDIPLPAIEPTEPLPETLKLTGSEEEAVGKAEVNKSLGKLTNAGREYFLCCQDGGLGELELIISKFKLLKLIVLEINPKHQRRKIVTEAPI